MKIAVPDVIHCTTKISRVKGIFIPEKLKGEGHSPPASTTPGHFAAPSLVIHNVTES